MNLVGFFIFMLLFSGIRAQQSLERFKAATGRYGFRDKFGIAIPAKYEGANDFKEGLASVQQNEKWGFIDEDGFLFSFL